MPSKSGVRLNAYFRISEGPALAGVFDEGHPAQIMFLRVVQKKVGETFSLRLIEGNGRIQLYDHTKLPCA